MNAKEYAKIINDAYVNSISGFGSSKDPSIAIPYQSGFILDKATLESQFRTNWIARKIIEVPTEDALREWITFSTKDKEISEDLLARMEEMNVQKVFYEAILLARLYGGSVIFVGAMDGGSPETPLNEDNIQSINFLHVFDRWQARIETRFKDPLAVNFDQPELYSLQPTSFQGQIIRKLVHSSRMIRFDGNFLPKISIISHVNQGWHDSSLTVLDLALRNFGVSQQSGATLLQDFITKVLKVPGLADLLAQDSSIINKRFELMQSNMSNFSFMAIGDEEEFAKIQTPITGLVDLMEQYVTYISSASGIPRTRLFGQQLGTLAGAEETTKEYFDRIKSWQIRDILPNMNRLITLMLKDKSSKTKGIEPDDWTVSFKSLVQDDNKTKAEIKKIAAETDKIYIENGVLDVATVKKIRFSSDRDSGTVISKTDEHDKYIETENEAEDDDMLKILDFHIHKQHDGSRTGPAMKVDKKDHIHLESSSILPESPIWTGIQRNIEAGHHIHTESTGQNTSMEI